MKLFISWSGARSRAVALALRNWLPDLLQEIEPFMSESDIGVGARWATELTKTLDSTDVGVLCLTPENLQAPWLVFEAGSLAKKLEISRVVPYNINLKSTEVPFPLAQFQSVDANREGTLKLLKMLNAFRSQPVENERLERLFARLWKDLEYDIKAASALPSAPPSSRSERELLDEILQLVRSQYDLSASRALARYYDLGFEHIGDAAILAFGVTAEVYWHAQGFTRDEALEICGVLKNRGIPCKLAPHRDPQVPDAVFIGALVPAEAAQMTLRAVPYKIKYIFRPDYPEEQGGSSSGLKIGIGYRSNHLAGKREARAEPRLVSEKDLAQLLVPGISNVDFQRCLRRITGME